jgi:hypothetical protein
VYPEKEVGENEDEAPAPSRLGIKCFPEREKEEKSNKVMRVAMYPSMNEKNRMAVLDGGGVV